MLENNPPWDDNDDLDDFRDDGFLIPQDTPPEDMDSNELEDYVWNYGFLYESPYAPQSTSFPSLPLEMEEEIIFSCLMMCRRRIEELRIDFLSHFEWKETENPEEISREDIDLKETRGSSLDIDVMPWLVHKDYYRYAVHHLMDMVAIFERRLIESLNVRFLSYGYRYSIVYPFQVVLSQRKGGLFYYTRDAVLDAWARKTLDVRSIEKD